MATRIENVLLGAEIRRYRKQAKLSTRALDRAMDMGVGFTSQIERGLRMADFGTVLDIAAIIGAEPLILYRNAEEAVRAHYRETGQRPVTRPDEK